MHLYLEEYDELFQLLSMLEQKLIQILKEHKKLHLKMVPIAFDNFFGVVKNASQTILRTYMNMKWWRDQVIYSKANFWLLEAF